MRQLAGRVDDIGNMMREAEKQHPNRWDFLKMDGTKTREQFISEFQGMNSNSGNALLARTRTRTPPRIPSQSLRLQPLDSQVNLLSSVQTNPQPLEEILRPALLVRPPRTVHSASQPSVAIHLDNHPSRHRHLDNRASPRRRSANRHNQHRRSVSLHKPHRHSVLPGLEHLLRRTRSQQLQHQADSANHLNLPLVSDSPLSQRQPLDSHLSLPRVSGKPPSQHRPSDKPPSQHQPSDKLPSQHHPSDSHPSPPQPLVNLHNPLRRLGNQASQPPHSDSLHNQVHRSVSLQHSDKPHLLSVKQVSPRQPSAKAHNQDLLSDNQANLRLDLASQHLVRVLPLPLDNHQRQSILSGTKLSSSNSPMIKPWMRCHLVHHALQLEGIRSVRQPSPHNKPAHQLQHNQYRHHRHRNLSSTPRQLHTH